MSTPSAEPVNGVKPYKKKQSYLRILRTDIDARHEIADIVHRPAGHILVQSGALRLRSLRQSAGAARRRRLHPRPLQGRRRCRRQVQGRRRVLPLHALQQPLQLGLFGRPHHGQQRLGRGHVDQRREHMAIGERVEQGGKVGLLGGGFGLLRRLKGGNEVREVGRLETRVERRGEAVPGGAEVAEKTALPQFGSLNNFATLTRSDSRCCIWRRGCA